MKLKEDGVGVGAPTNNAGGGSVAGIGVGPKGEPGMPVSSQKKRYGKTKSPLLFPDMMKRTVPSLVKEETFAGATVFEVSSSVFHNLTMQKRKGKHWRIYLEEDDSYMEIREWAKKNKGPIIVRNATTSEMRYVRYGKG